MPREARITIPGRIYHVLNRGNNKEIIFSDDEDFNFFLQQIKKYKEKFKVKIYHYCLMPNHHHFLTKPEMSQSLAKFMHGLMLVHAQHIRRKYNKIGHIWQGRYKSSLVESEEYLARCGYYIEDNPRRAGLVEDLKDWPWSSYKFYVYGIPDPIVDVDPEYFNLGTMAGEWQENYQKFITANQNKEQIKLLRQKLNQGIFGSDRYIQEMVEKFKIKLKGVKKAGRPPTKNSYPSLII